MRLRLKPGTGSQHQTRTALKMLLILLLSALVPGHSPSLAQDTQTSSAQNSARITQAPNSRVSMMLPPTFQPSKLYSGFEDQNRGISIVILEVPRLAYNEMKNSLTPERLATQGVSDSQLGQLARQGDYVYMQARQSSAAGKFAKFFILFPTADQTVLISVNVPIKALEADNAVVDEIEQALASAQTVPTAQIKELFKLNYLGPFKEAGRVAGSSKLYSLDGRLEPEYKGMSRPVLIVAPSIDKRPITDINAAAKAMIKSLPQYKDMAVEDPEPVTISGMNGVSLKATALDLSSGMPVVIYQVLLVARDGGYYRLIGLIPETDAERLLPEVVRISQSFAEEPG